MHCSTVWGPTSPILTFAISCLKHQKTRGWVYMVWSSTGHPHIIPHPSSYKKLPICTGSQSLRFTSGSSITWPSEPNNSRARLPLSTFFSLYLAPLCLRSRLTTVYSMSFHGQDYASRAHLPAVSVLSLPICSVLLKVSEQCAQGSW